MHLMHFKVFSFCQYAQLTKIKTHEKKKKISQSTVTVLASFPGCMEGDKTPTSFLFPSSPSLPGHEGIRTSCPSLFSPSLPGHEGIRTSCPSLFSPSLPGHEGARAKQPTRCSGVKTVTQLHRHVHHLALCTLWQRI